MSLDYTGGGKITEFQVSFRVQGSLEWNNNATVPAERVEDADVDSSDSSSDWTAVISQPVFEQPSQFDFLVAIVNERNLSILIELPETQGKPTGFCLCMYVYICVLSG